MNRLLLTACFVAAASSSCNPAPKPANQKTQGGERMAISPELRSFLAAEDLDDALNARGAIKTLRADDRVAIHLILKQWQDTQAVSNLLIHPALIPEDVRLACLFRGLAERQVLYYNLAAIVGFGAIEADKLADDERKRIATELLAVIRNTKDVRAARATVSIRSFVSESDAPQVAALLEHPDSTVRTNLSAWLFEAFKDRGVEALAAAVGKSGLTGAAQERIVSQFKDWLTKPTTFGPLFAYIPNLRDCQ